MRVLSLFDGISCGRIALERVGIPIETYYASEIDKYAIEYMNRKIADGRTHWDFGHHSDIHNDKSSAIVANFFKGVPYNVFKNWSCIRKFHPIECERLQTLPVFSFIDKNDL